MLPTLVVEVLSWRVVVVAACWNLLRRSLIRHTCILSVIIATLCCTLYIVIITRVALSLARASFGTASRPAIPSLNPVRAMILVIPTLPALPLLHIIQTLLATLLLPSTHGHVFFGHVFFGGTSVLTSRNGMGPTPFGLVRQQDPKRESVCEWDGEQGERRVDGKYSVDRSPVDNNAGEEAGDTPTHSTP